MHSRRSRSRRANCSAGSWPAAGIYASTLNVTLTDAETRRIEKAAQPTRSLKAFELYSRAQLALSQRPGQEGNEQAVDLLARAIEADPAFVVAQYRLGRVHQTLGHLWKANAQFRASIQLDTNYPEPYKSLGDLSLAAARTPTIRRSRRTPRRSS